MSVCQKRGPGSQHLPPVKPQIPPRADSPRLCLTPPQVWPEGEDGGSVGTLFTGTFHPFAGSPPTPLQQLRVDLSAAAVSARLEPDENTDLVFSCQSTQQAATHAAYRSVLDFAALSDPPPLAPCPSDSSLPLIP